MFCLKGVVPYEQSFGIRFRRVNGRAILAEYNGEKIEYNEIHRFDNVLCEQNGMLCWDFDYLLGEVKGNFSCGKCRLSCV
ncbi:MAG: hypothetical protein ACLR6O_05670 [Eubacterium sp.]